MEGNSYNSFSKKPEATPAPEQLGSQLPPEVFDRMHTYFNSMVLSNKIKKDDTSPLTNLEATKKALEEVATMPNEVIIAMCSDPEKLTQLFDDKAKFIAIYKRLQIKPI